MKNAFLLTITLTCLTALVGTGAFARDVTGLTVADGTVTVTSSAINPAASIATVPTIAIRTKSFFI